MALSKMLGLFLPRRVHLQVRAAGLLVLLVLALVLRSCTEPSAPPATCFVGGPGPRQSWRGFGGPAYLPARLPRRPPQRVLDSAARAARRRRV